MTELQQNRYDQLLRKVGDLKGPGSKVSEVLTELFPTFDVENMPPELIRLSGARLGHGGGTITAIAAQSPTGILVNPAGSGKIITITRVYASSNAISVVRWGTTVTVRGTAVNTQQFRDTRDRAPSLPSGSIRQISAVAAAVGTNQTRVLASTNLTLDDPAGIAVLAPDTAFEIGLGALVSTLQFAFSWKERTAEPSEVGP